MYKLASGPSWLVIKNKSDKIKFWDPLKLNIRSETMAVITPHSGVLLGVSKYPLFDINLYPPIFQFEIILTSASISN